MFLWNAKSHKNIHTDLEIKWIKDLVRRNPHISMCELYGKLRTERGYSRSALALFRVLRKLNFYIDKEKHKKYIPPKQLIEQCQNSFRERKKLEKEKIKQKKEKKEKYRKDKQTTTI